MTYRDFKKAIALLHRQGCVLLCNDGFHATPKGIAVLAELESQLVRQGLRHVATRRWARSRRTA